MHISQTRLYTGYKFVHVMQTVYHTSVCCVCVLFVCNVCECECVCVLRGDVCECLPCRHLLFLSVINSTLSLAFTHTTLLIYFISTASSERANDEDGVLRLHVSCEDQARERQVGGDDAAYPSPAENVN